ncbi:10828_t:CDS:1 [Paraglomus occultum]|uniref:10828_t:CDS:1 n=1 Tax=Paraglomus occultum TaxID=144539 RepID=A0A9N9BM85_9GLOM|nr:10828_t:CDS:1 [Paraglomus occultum]
MSSFTHSYSQSESSSSYQEQQASRVRHSRPFRPFSSSSRAHIFEPDQPCSLNEFLGGVNYDRTKDDIQIYDRAVKFFRNVLNKIEIDCQWHHFKFMVFEEDDRFYVKVSRVKNRPPPAKVANCLSCDSESETNRASSLPYPSTTLECEKLHRLWFDAKARPMFIVTPERHVERLSDCTDEEIFEMFHLTCQLLDEEARSTNAPWETGMFERMTLNHGNARNLEHLHLKIWVNESKFEWMKSRWDKEKREKFELLESGLYRRDSRVKRIPRRKWHKGREGEREREGKREVRSF